jgi:hypothetical protein
VDLAPELTMPGGMAAQGAINGADGDPIILQELLARVWISHGVVGWNLVDGRGRPRPISAEAVLREFPYSRGGRLIAEACDSLYADEILAPLRDRLRTLSEPGSTGSTRQETSARRASTTRRRKPSSTEPTDREPPPG